MNCMSKEDDAKAESQYLDGIKEGLDKHFVIVKEKLGALDQNIDRSFDRLEKTLDRTTAETHALLRQILIDQEEGEPE